MIRLIAAATLLALASGPALAADEVTTETIKFAPGAISATKNDTLKGYAIRNYVIAARAGQVMSVLLSKRRGGCFFLVYPPGGGETAVFNGDISGNEYAANLTDTGDYVIRVGQNRAQARRKESCRYSITFEVSG